MTKRKLASVQLIKTIESVKDADRLEVATVEGWKVVVKKGQFKPGDKVVYYEIDSFLPIRSVYEFLRPTCYKKSELLGEGFRIRTMKLRGVYSQGLIMALSDLGVTEATEVGTDLTETLNVRKWEVPEMATSGGTIVGLLPYDVPHTDETRYQVFPEWKQEFAGPKKYYISTKMDGSSYSVSVDENGFHVCGHHYEYRDDGKCSFYNFVNKHNLKNMIMDYIGIKNICDSSIKTLTIQGEYCGPGICKNKLKLSKPEWYVFTVKVNGERVSLEKMLAICDDLNLDPVPIEEVDYDLPSKYPDDESLQKRSDGKYPGGNRKEGIVIRTCIPEYSETLQDYLSMKVVNNKYLLKSNE